MDIQKWPNYPRNFTDFEVIATYRQWQVDYAAWEKSWRRWAYAEALYRQARATHGTPLWALAGWAVTEFEPPRFDEELGPVDRIRIGLDAMRERGDRQVGVTTEWLRNCILTAPTRTHRVAA